MRTRGATILTVLALLGSSGPARADEAADARAKQKAAADATWAKLELGKPTVAETKDLLVYAVKPAKDLKVNLDGLQRQYALAARALKYDDKENRPWPGKLTLYLFDERSQFATFLRKAEGRSPQADDVSSSMARGDTPYAAVGVPRAASATPYDLQTTVQITATLLARKGGTTAQFPDWLAEGFGRATAYRASLTVANPKASNPNWRRVVKGRAAKTLWEGTLTPAEMVGFAAQLVDFLAYGPGAAEFPTFVQAFRPDEGKIPTVSAALESAKFPPDVFEKAWRKWNGLK